MLSFVEITFCCLFYDQAIYIFVIFLTLLILNGFVSNHKVGRFVLATISNACFNESVLFKYLEVFYF